MAVANGGTIKGIHFIDYGQKISAGNNCSARAATLIDPQEEVAFVTLGRAVNYSVRSLQLSLCCIGLRIMEKVTLGKTLMLQA